MVEHSRSGEKHLTASRAFAYTSFVLYHFLRALQQNRAQSRLLDLLNNDETSSITSKELASKLPMVWSLLRNFVSVLNKGRQFMD